MYTQNTVEKTRSSFTKVCLAAAILTALTILFTGSVTADPYVLKTGSTSTGLQVFQGTNGQIQLPPTYEPPVSASGKIYNDTVLGLMIYRDGAWHQVGSTAGISGIVTQFGTSAPNTVTAIKFSTGLTGSTSGTTSTVSVDLGTSSGQAMPGNQSLSGDVTGPVGSTALSSSVNVSTTGTIKSSGGTSLLDQTANSPVSLDANKKLVASGGSGTAGQVLMSNGPTTPGSYQALPAQSYLSAGAAIRNLQVQLQSAKTFYIAYDALELTDSSGNTTVTRDFSTTGNLASSGLLGLDTGSVTIDADYYWYVAVKQDGTGPTVIGSRQKIAASVTWPSGWSTAFRRRVGGGYTAHTSTNLLFGYQQNTRFFYTNTIDNQLTADGNGVLWDGSATSFTTWNPYTRLIQTAGIMYCKPEPYANSALASVQLSLSWDGGANSYDWIFQSPNSSTTLNNFEYANTPIPIIPGGSIWYKLSSSNARVRILLTGWDDPI